MDIVDYIVGGLGFFGTFFVLWVAYQAVSVWESITFWNDLAIRSRKKTDP